VVWFDDADLRLEAGDTWYARGLDYVDEVDELRWSSCEVVATVRGADAYQVRLSNRDGELDAVCSCPWGQKGNFCKHCVAVGLAALAHVPPEPPVPAPGPGAVGMVDLRAYLSGVDPAALVELLVKLAGTDPALHQLLLLRADGTGGPNPMELHPVVDALRVTGHLDDAELASWGRRADEALHTLDTLATDHPATIRPLYQRVLRHLVDMDLDDGSGDAVAAVRSAAARAVKGVAAACRTAPVESDELARWLLGLQLDAPYLPDIAVTDLADALGEEGLALYWQHLCRLHASHSSVANDDDDYWADDEEGEEREESRGETIFRLREKYLMDIAGDVDGLVALYAEDLSDPRRYIQIAETLRSAGRIDEAITWLRRGLSDETWLRGRIGDLLVELYTQNGCYKEAAGIRWDNFVHNPSEYNYHMLLRAAGRLDALKYAKDRAMSHLRERAARGGGHAADSLVTILVAARDIDQAWAAAQEFDCSDTCMFLLARNRAKSHPADAIPIYAREVDAAIGRKDRYGYTRAAELLVALKDLHQRASCDFATYLSGIKVTHRRKTALMEALTDAGL
jgi:SWIM zinc finger